MGATRDKLIDGFIRHKVALVGEENGAARDIAHLWQIAVPRLAIVQTERLRGRRLRNVLEHRARVMLLTLAGFVEDSEMWLRAVLRKVAMDEYNTTMNILDRAVPVSVLDIVGGVSPVTEAQREKPTRIPIPPRVVDGFIKGPIAGRTWDKRLRDIEPDTKRLLTRRINGFVREGTPVPEAARSLDRLLKRGRQRAELIARTEIHNVSIRTQNAIFKKNRRLLSGVEYLATLDERTCIICGARDRETFYFNPTEGQRRYGERPFIPMHPRCRCVYLPMTRWAETFGPITPGARASMAGPAGPRVTFKGWLQKQGTDTVLKILGQTRGSLYLKGQAAVGDFVAKDVVLKLTDLAPSAAGPPSEIETLLIRREELRKKINAQLGLINRARTETTKQQYRMERVAFQAERRKIDMQVKALRQKR